MPTKNNFTIFYQSLTSSIALCSPEGKKFRSRNELRSHFIQIGSSMNSEDFDFSVKGKGHHNKGKSPTKKSESESSKDHKVSKKSTTPVVSKRNTPRTSTTPIERPKRELRKRLRSEPTEEPVKEPEELEEEDDFIDDADEDEISNVKLKVKVGYTATGAMIRPSTNGNRKKKRRFRNMNVKKTKTGAKTVPKPTVSTSRKASPAASLSAHSQIKEESKDSLTSLRTRQTLRRKRKGKAAEPVAGPSGLQKVKRSPRRILKRKGNADDDEEDDDEDLDYVCSLYPDQSQSASSAKSSESITHEMSDAPPDPLQISEDDIKAPNGVVNGAEELHSANHSHHIEPHGSTNGLKDPLSITAELDSIGSSVVIEETVHIEEVEVNDDQMQVVVIGDTVDVHNYAKPHSL